MRSASLRRVVTWEPWADRKQRETPSLLPWLVRAGAICPFLQQVCLHLPNGESLATDLDACSAHGAGSLVGRQTDRQRSGTWNRM